MKIKITNFKQAIDLVYKILNQGDNRYNQVREEVFLAKLLLNNAISLEQQKIPSIPDKEILNKHKMGYVQLDEKQLACQLLLTEGFKQSQIYFERLFRGSRPDILAENLSKIIPVECCSCRVDKILDYLQEVEEVWVITKGETPWNPKILNEPAEWFKFKRSLNWKMNFLLQKRELQELKKVKSPLDSL